MKALIIYDSVFGNTEKVAQAITDSLKSTMDVESIRIGDLTSEKLNVDLLIVGSPTRKFSATPATFEMIKSIPAKGLEGVKAATFDTRVHLDDIKSSALKLLVNVAGYAAERIAKRLEAKGAQVVQSMGFYVGGTEGPMKDGELERAEKWAKQLC